MTAVHPHDQVIDIAIPKVELTTGSHPVQQAELLRVLEEGSQRAWAYAVEGNRMDAADHRARLDYAADVDGVFRDALWETLDTETRRPGESVQEFGARVEADEARKLGAEMATEIVSRELEEGKDPDAILQDNAPTIQAVCEKATTPRAQAYAAEFAYTTHVLVLDARELEAE